MNNINTTQLNKIVEVCEINEACLDHLLQKLSASQRRKQKFSEYGTITMSRQHWRNHAGTYKDEECKIPKYYKSNLPPAQFTHINSYHELVSAIRTIAEGKAKQDQYRNLSSLNRERVRYAQSLTDQRQDIDPQKIARMGFPELKQEEKRRAFSYWSTRRYN